MKTTWKPLGGARYCGLFLLVAGLFGGGCQSTHERYVFSPLPESLTEDARTDQYTHWVAQGEEITFHFPDGTNHTARVRADGTITLPLVGNVTAAGKTSRELALEVRDLYVPRFYSHWSIPFPAEQRVYSVGGQVKAPGRQVYLGATTVTKAIQSAGGFTDFAARTRVGLTRADGKSLEVNCAQTMKDASLDLPVYPGDKIVVPARTLWDSFRW